MPISWPLRLRAAERSRDAIVIALPVRVPLPIETERLLIRDFDPARDSETMLSVYGDPEVMRFIPGGALPGFDAVRKTARRVSTRFSR